MKTIVLILAFIFQTAAGQNPKPSDLAGTVFRRTLDDISAQLIIEMNDLGKVGSVVSEFNEVEALKVDCLQEMLFAVHNNLRHLETLSHILSEMCNANRKELGLFISNQTVFVWTDIPSFSGRLRLLDSNVSQVRQISDNVALLLDTLNQATDRWLGQLRRSRRN